MNKFAEKIRDIRLMRNLKQVDVCSILAGESNQFESIDTTTYSRWEKGIIVPAPIKQAAMLDILGKLSSYDAIIPSVNKAKAKVHAELLHKLFPDDGVKTYFSDSEFKVLKTLPEIEDVLRDGRVYRHTHQVVDDFSWLFDNYSLEEMVNSFEMELLGYYYDGLLINHVLLATVPVESITNRVPNGEYFRSIIVKSSGTDYVNVLSSSVVTDLDFMHLSIAYICSKNFSNSNWLRSPTVSQVHSYLWRKLFNLYGSKSLPAFIKHGQPCNYQIFEPYSFMTSFIIEKTYNDNIDKIVRWI
ncbi:helix-turn-helix domain-containing protein [Vibrio hepatarius]|uniref:helix-turn-helix domain-containing protein n=1 Tax=Vibrio hepatarius TaxID=171383 RepID=UPI003736B786